jgi:hypothetical protein
MTAEFLKQIDWSRPWLAHIRDVGETIANAADWRAELNQCAMQRGLFNHCHLPIRFVQQAELPSGVAYEAHISQTGCVPTRNNLHDFFNALVWLTFPRIKAQLNALQASEIKRSTITNNSAPRGKVRDAATIFDENAALLVTTDQGLVAALRSHEWLEAFHSRREEFNQRCAIFLFGHALMEKLVSPYKAITAHMWVAPIEIASNIIDSRYVSLDAYVSGQLQDSLTTKDFSPLPILGVPDWCELQDKIFYNDASVFRPKRT